MPRHNKRSSKKAPQHSKGRARPRDWHRKASSPGMKRQVAFLERTRQPPEEKAA